jgi:endonuclease YncB( thermonuclease family)
MNVSDWPLYHYRATVRGITDGDSIKVSLDLGDDTERRRRIRLLGYNAPEKRARGGTDALNALARILPVGSRIYIRTEKDEQSFERLLGWVYAPGNGNDLLDVAEAMIAGGYGEHA